MKFIVVLYADQGSDRVITCIVTKQTSDKDKNRTAGCQFGAQRFFIPANSTYLEFDSYLQLPRLKEFSYAGFPKDPTFVLSQVMIGQIKNCLKKLVADIPPEFFPLVT